MGLRQDLKFLLTTVFGNLLNCEFRRHRLAVVDGNTACYPPTHSTKILQKPSSNSQKIKPSQVKST